MAQGWSVPRFFGFLIVSFVGELPTLASSPEATTGAPVIAVSRAAAVAPRVNRRVPNRIRSTIESGFELAVDKLAHEPECRDLFANLGANGVEVLSTTLYYLADLKMEKRVCSKALAFTLVGGAPTWVCQRFAGLNDRRAAAVLLHEALHHAGLDEWPHDPDGLPPAAIDDLVGKACGF